MNQIPAHSITCYNPSAPTTSGNPMGYGDDVRHLEHRSTADRRTRVHLLQPVVLLVQRDAVDQCRTGQEGYTARRPHELVSTKA